MKRTRKTGCFLAEDEYNRLEMIFEQIEGLAELMFLALQNEIEQDSAAMTAYTVTKDKVKEAVGIARAGYAAFAESANKKRLK